MASTPSLFKLAAVRGINHTLVAAGLARYPSKFAADAAADHVAANAPQLPDGPEGGSGEGAHSKEDVMAVAQQLMQIAQQLMAEAESGAAAGAPGIPPPHAAAPAAEEMGKQAAAADLEEMANYVANELMQKRASIGDKVEISKDKNKNTPESAAKDEGLAKLDQAQRPTEAYHKGPGKTDMDTAPGMVGKMQEQPAAPKTTVSGTNSVNEDASKKASLESFRAAVKQAAIGDKVEIAKDKNKNTEQHAAGTEGLAKLDAKQRPAGYALVGVGNANFKEPAAARIGMEQPHPNGPKTTVTGTNSVIEASKVSEDQFQAAHELMFRNCAEKVAAALPATITEEQKVAAINAMIAMNDGGRQRYLSQMAACKTAGELSEMLGLSVGAEEKKDEPKAEKKDAPKAEEKQAAATNPMMARLLAIANDAAKK